MLPFQQSFIFFGRHTLGKYVLNLVPQGEGSELIKGSLSGGLPEEGVKIIFSDGFSQFPFMMKGVMRGLVADECILTGTADTPRKGSHRVMIELSLSNMNGRFLQT